MAKFEGKNQTEWAKHYGVSRNAISLRMKRFGTPHPNQILEIRNISKEERIAKRIAAKLAVREQHRAAKHAAKEQKVANELAAKEQRRAAKLAAKQAKCDQYLAQKLQGRREVNGIYLPVRWERMYPSDRRRWWKKFGNGGDLPA